MIIGWVFFSIIVGLIGSSKNIGFFGALFLSLLLSPIIGLIITLFSSSKDDKRYKQQILVTNKKQEATLSEIQLNTLKFNITTELSKLKEMKEQGHLTEEEYQRAKNKLLG